MPTCACLVVIMGPSGCGKSTLAAALVASAGGVMLDADDFHSPANTAKMESSEPLTDDDRVAWVDAILSAIDRCDAEIVWLACSALTPFVQSKLRALPSRKVSFVYLDLPPDHLRQRVEQRRDHFMPASLLQSQLDTLILPDKALVLDARAPVHKLAKSVQSGLDKERHQQDHQKADRPDKS